MGQYEQRKNQSLYLYFPKFFSTDELLMIISHNY